MSGGRTNPAPMHATILNDGSVVADVCVDKNKQKYPCRGVMVTASGDAVLQDSNGTEITYPVTAGQTLSFRPHRSMAGTTATLVAWYGD